MLMAGKFPVHLPRWLRFPMLSRGSLCRKSVSVLQAFWFIVPDSMKVANWIKRLGFVGFMFFLVKGLLWLLVPALIAFLATN